MVSYPWRLEFSLPLLLTTSDLTSHFFSPKWLCLHSLALWQRNYFLCCTLTLWEYFNVPECEGLLLEDLSSQEGYSHSLLNIKMSAYVLFIHIWKWDKLTHGHVRYVWWLLYQGCTNPRCHIAMGPNFVWVSPNICGPFVWNLLYIT